jgi:YD repeat-containing protein
LGTALFEISGDARTVAVSTPDRGTVRQVSDALGRVTAVSQGSVPRAPGQSSVPGLGGVSTELFAATFEPQFGRLAQTRNARGLVMVAAPEPGFPVEISAFSDELTPAGGHNGVVESRDRNGRVRALRDANNLLHEYEYDADGRLVRSVGPDGLAVVWSYPAGRARLASVTRGSETVTVASYNELGQPVLIVDGAGRQVSRTYDAFGRLRAENAGGITTAYLYDEATGQVNAVLRPGESTAYIRDAFGRITSVLDGNGRETRWEYDNADRVTKIVYADGK